MEKSKDDEYSRIPVFVFPSPIIFNANERDNTKQILTIYNPYDFPVRFKVLSTAPSNYTVIDPEGSIKAKNSVDLIVRLTTSLPCDSSQSQIEDKFRVQIYNYDTRQQVGRRDVPSIVHFGNTATTSTGSTYGGQGSYNNPGYGSSGPSSDTFQSCPSTGGMKSDIGFLPGSGNSMFYGPGQNGAFGGHYNHPNYVAVFTALVCIIGLLLPTNHGDRDINSPGMVPERSDSTTSSYILSLPSYFQLSVNQKLIIAYTLGLVTMVIFRPQ